MKIQIAVLLMLQIYSCACRFILKHWYPTYIIRLIFQSAERLNLITSNIVSRINPKALSERYPRLLVFWPLGSMKHFLYTSIFKKKMEKKSIWLLSQRNKQAQGFSGSLSGSFKLSWPGPFSFVFSPSPLYFHLTAALIGSHSQHTAVPEAQRQRASCYKPSVHVPIKFIHWNLISNVTAHEVGYFLVIRSWGPYPHELN